MLPLLPSCHEGVSGGNSENGIPFKGCFGLRLLSGQFCAQMACFYNICLIFMLFSRSDNMVDRASDGSRGIGPS